ncbi:MAG: hypothetical protein JWM44_2244 [Bacilli bacterium]|jgi:hypothetical protein|nr:hypothetical protein [Bacilli bacterium]
MKNFILDEGGAATMIATLIVTIVLVVFSFMLVPYFVFIMQRDHIQMIANHALKEAEVAGYVSNTIISNTTAKLASTGLGSVTMNGGSYPDFNGSTHSKVLRDDTDPTIHLVIKYPAANLSRLFTSLGGQAESSNGFYYIELSGRSEAYE